jgi:hypothetical protein
MKTSFSRTQWPALLIAILLLGSLALNGYCYEQYMSMKMELPTWIQLAANSSADYNFLRGDLRFYELGGNEPNLGASKDKKSWSIYSHTPGDDNKEFVDAYNRKLRSLTHQD